jgi:hypothetical protein
MPFSGNCASHHSPDAFWYRGTVNFSRVMSDSDADHFRCCSRTNIFSSEKNISSPVCQLSRILARLKRFSTVADNCGSFFSTNRMVSRFNFKSAAKFWPNSLKCLLEDHPGGYGPFSVRVFTSSGAPRFNVMFGSLINEILLRI